MPPSTRLHPPRPTLIGLVALALLAAGAAQALAAPRVVDVSERAGIAEVAQTWSSEAGDFNDDGWTDLLVGHHYEKPAYLYRNEGDGSFTRVARAAFPSSDRDPPRDRHDCSFGDANQDGLEDIFCSTGADRGAGVGPNELWLQGPPGSFTDHASAYGVADRYGRGRDNTFVDVNEDGYEDLYLGNKFPRADGRISKNKLFINVGGDHFRSGREYGLDRQVGGKIVQKVDYDRDGWDDLLVCGERHVYLYRNVAGQRFEDVSRVANIDKPCESVVMAKLNRDSRPDLAIVTNTRLKVMAHRRDGSFGPPTFKRRLRGGTEIASGKASSGPIADLYIVQRADPDRDEPDLLLTSRRGGSRFAPIDIPQTRRGEGDYVISLDYDNNGRSDFLVMNGFHKHPGPIRLLATRP